MASLASRVDTLTRMTRPPDPPEKTESDREKAPSRDESTGAGGTLDYFTPSTSPTLLVTIRRLPGAEAELAAAKLESEGIPCFIADSHLSATHAMLVSEVRLQVHAENAERAIEILDRPPDDAAADEYVDEEFRCPRCRRKGIDLLPLSDNWRRARAGCLILLLAPVLLTLVLWALPSPALHARVQRIVSYVGWPWFAVVLVLSVTVMLVKRRKRCRTCGHEWGDAPERDDRG